MLPAPDISIAGRTGDTPADERRLLARRPPDILVTTPESLYLLLTSQARDILRNVEHVIVDEVHAVAGTKRGAHLALSLEPLERLRPASAPPLQRIGLSATQRPLEEVARFLGGGEDLRTWRPRPVAIVDAGAKKPFDLRVEVPVEDMSRLGEAIEPSAEELPEGAASHLPRRWIWPAGLASARPLCGHSHDLPGLTSKGALSTTDAASRSCCTPRLRASVIGIRGGRRVTTDRAR